MAITRADIELWRTLKARGLLPPKPRVLEIGEANWWGDVDACAVPEICCNGAEFLETADPFALAKAFYRDVLDYRSISAIDMAGTPKAFRIDLNESITEWKEGCWELFNIIINTGTAEHVFRLAQVYETIHEHTRPGGLMIHSAPLTGWLNHGFYNLQPCFFADLAAANRYETLVCLYQEMGGKVEEKPFHEMEPTGESMIHVAFRKVGDEAFRVPMQRKG